MRPDRYGSGRRCSAFFSGEGKDSRHVYPNPRDDVARVSRPAALSSQFRLGSPRRSTISIRSRPASSGSSERTSAITNANAFQHAWFDVLAAKLGYAGTIKWDAYFSRYNRGV